MPFKIIHERWKCIGCNACVAVSPEHWEMNEDGQSDIKNSVHKKVAEGILEELEVKEPGTNKDAEESCPVSCIHVKKVE